MQEGFDSPRARQILTLHNRVVIVRAAATRLIVNHLTFRRVDIPAGVSVMAIAVGAFAVGALAIGALAVGRLAIKRMALEKAQIGNIEVENLTIRRLHVIEPIQTSQLTQ